MKLGFVTAIVPDLSLEEVLGFAAQEGFETVEVMCWPKGKAERRYAGVTHIDVARLDEREVERIQGLVEKTGVEISGLGYYPNPLSPNGEESCTAIEHIRKVIVASRRLGINLVNTFIGRDWTRSIDENWPRVLETWKPLIDFAEDQGVRVGIENCPMFFTGDEWPGGKNLAFSPRIWRRMFEDIPSDHFGLNFDPSHLVWLRIDYLKALREFATKIFHVHAKDVRLDQHRLDEVGILATPLEYHTPKLPGLGEVDWGKFFSVLTETGYRGPVCVEVEDRAYEGSLADRKASLRQSLNFLRQYVPERKGLER
ncbi:MAG TPA: sugar phosphate isomerase/epimerase family protein [Acidobacteriota bacterium]|jgi:sugar phosphate isomerase/epimerase|nr:sugar phosphate isomerase/epimerase family protein [Acidobacteriota bacterium]HRR56616.1 sugar phosphate isomerase/epimerase family protein [Acidobacteriota bacterium]HRV06827.1 sugar phosphate isomerase/epimerase family protein [Acidobacteriota bacterium]